MYNMLQHAAALRLLYSVKCEATRLTNELWLEVRSCGTREEGGLPWGEACRWAGPSFTLVANVLRNCWAHDGRALGGKIIV